MVTKFHISKNGMPALCKAKDGNCPLKQKIHYKTKEEAQLAADKINEEQYGIIPKDENITFKRKPKKEKQFIKAFKMEHKEHIDKRLEEMSQDGNESYYSRCKSVVKDHQFKPSNHEVIHFKKDRIKRSEQIEKNFGRGDLIGFYKVNHKMGNKSEEYREQMIEVRDNGSLTIYDIKTGNKITTFVAMSKRIELMMLKAGEIPNESLLKKIDENKREAFKKKIND